MENKDTIIGYILIAVGLVIALTLSIWLGFASPNYNRVPISIFLYLIATATTTVGFLALIKKR